jgi:uncharacterized RDD family membrane protein YckC
METQQQKITEIRLTEKIFVYELNATGERVRVEKEVPKFKEVKCVRSWTRFGHFVIDRILSEIFFYAVNIGIIFQMIFFQGVGNINEQETELSLTIFNYIILFPLYYFFWEYFFQKTPGKWITKCRVVNVYGEKPSLFQILGRSYARLIPFEVFSCLNDRGWHDTMSNTYLVKETHLSELRAIMKIDEIGSGKVDLPDEDLQPGF